MIYIRNNKLLFDYAIGEDLIKILECANERIIIHSDLIKQIIIKEIYNVEIRHYKTFTFYNKDNFEQFMIAMGSTKGGILTGVRYSLYGNEIITRKYDCLITSTYSEDSQI